VRIVIVEDEADFAAILSRVLQAAGHAQVTIAATAEQALELPPPDVVVTDLRLPGRSGLELMQELRRRDPGVACILMTAFADVATAREALTSGAIDYLVKPFDNRELVALVERVAARSHGPAQAGEVLLGDSTAMRRVVSQLRQAAQGDATVLLLGESGTGKELAAQTIHALSARARNRLVDVHLAALPESTIENELFGHERGAFTGAEARSGGLLEAADAGTLFLDEIGELPVHVQPKILRVLQERTFFRIGGTTPVHVDVRVIAATNRDLPAAVAAGRFREDLFYRLDVMTITMPALRDRGEDVLLLANHLLGAHRPGACFTQAARDCLLRHAWPGNVRELSNAVERACVVANGVHIDASDLPERVRRCAPRAQDVATAASATLDHQSRERTLIRDALARAQGNKSLAAQLMGISRRRLYSRMKLLGLEEADADDPSRTSRDT
jgi:DNA-binding NtrC family response regulator